MAHVEGSGTAATGVSDVTCVSHTKIDGRSADSNSSNTCTHNIDRQISFLLIAKSFAVEF